LLAVEQLGLVEQELLDPLLNACARCGRDDAAHRHRPRIVRTAR
jgi:hypothetical protein